MNKKYKLTARCGGRSQVEYVWAPDRDTALRLAWEMFDADDIYVEEVNE